MRTKMLIGLVALLVVGFFAWNLFGPNSAVIVGRQTTFITQPLASDGLPNYVQALMDRHSEGVTPENNGAVLFWAAMGPANMREADYARLCEEISVDVAAAAKPLIDMSGPAIEAELAKRIEKEFGLDSSAEPDSSTKFPEAPSAQQIASEQLAWARRAAWGAEELPPLATLLAQNEQALDCLVEATARPRFYSPPPNALVDSRLPMIELLLSHAQAARTAASALAMRATFHTGTGAYDEAWQDCLRYGD